MLSATTAETVGTTQGEKEVGDRVTCGKCGRKTRIESSGFFGAFTGTPAQKIAGAVVAVLLVVGVASQFGLVGAISGIFGQKKKMATIKVGEGLVWAAGTPTYSGIENIYIMDNAHASGFAQDLSGNENILGVITQDGGSCTIPYETYFTIVPAVKADDDNMAYVQKENTKVELAASGAFSIAQENSTDANEVIFDGSEGGTYIRYNVTQWDNNGKGYKLRAGDNITIDPCRLWTWE